MTPEMAQARIAEIKMDKDFFNRLNQRDQSAHREWTALHKAAYPSDNTPEQQAASRNVEAWNSYFGTLRQHVPITPEQEAEIRGGVIRADLHAKAMEERERLRKDKGFQRRWADGDQEAVKKWGLLAEIKALRPVKS
jgi:hypothetical protein